MIYKKSKRLGIYILALIGMVLGWILLLAAVSFGETGTTIAKNDVEKKADNVEKPAAMQPVFTEYKGIKIGMTADEVHRLIDKKPKIEDKNGYYYVFSDDEAMQIILDENKKVKVISIIYTGENNAPSYEAVFGKDVPLEKNPDGRINKLIRYPEAGYWVAYLRGAGEKPVVTVTIQKMWNTQ